MTEPKFVLLSGVRIPLGAFPKFFLCFCLFSVANYFSLFYNMCGRFCRFLKAIFGDILWNNWNNHDLCWETTVNQRKRKKYIMKSISWDDAAKNAREKSVGRPTCCTSNKNASSYYYYSSFFDKILCTRFLENSSVVFHETFTKYAPLHEVVQSVIVFGKFASGAKLWTISWF